MAETKVLAGWLPSGVSEGESLPYISPTFWWLPADGGLL